MEPKEQEHLAALNQLLKEAAEGDEHGVKPDLTFAETEAIEWTIKKIEE